MPADQPPNQPTSRQTSQLGWPGTAPLGPPNPDQPAATGAFTESTGLQLLRERREVLGTIGRSTINLGKRMELLHRACVASGVGVPGVGAFSYQHPLTPSSGETLNYLIDLLIDTPYWSRAMQVAVFRWEDARNDVAKADMIDPPIAQLRLKLYHLHNLHTDFAEEAVLRQLFPPPPSTVVDTPRAAPARPRHTRALTEGDRLETSSRGSAASGFGQAWQSKPDPDSAPRKLALAQGLLQKLEPGMALVDMVLAMIDRQRAFSMADLLQPAPRLARMVALALIIEPGIVQQLRDARAAFGQLEQGLQVARQSGDPRGLDELAFPLSGLSQALAGHPLTKELFPPDYKRLFPQGLPRNGGGGGWVAA
jgi:hypothetical protein